MYLLDTNVVSELRRSRPHPAVVEWLQRVPAAQLHLCAVTVGEIQAGIEKTRAQDPAKAGMLEDWLDEVMVAYPILALDGVVFREWGKLMYRQSIALSQDAMIAAVARTHALTVVTRNVRDFQAFGIKILDPFSARAS